MDGHLLEGRDVLGQLLVRREERRAARQTKPAKSEYHEWLTYEFTEREPAKATVALKWEELQVPSRSRSTTRTRSGSTTCARDLRGSAGFNWQNWQQAADFCAQNKIDLPEALKWAERAVSDPNVGRRGELPDAHDALPAPGAERQDAEAAKTFDKALNHPTATPIQIHQVGRQLMADGKKEQAMSIFQLNAKRFRTSGRSTSG